MIIFGCPVGFNHIFKIAWDQCLRLVHGFRSKDSRRIHVIYFSYVNDIEMLKLSLASLMKLDEGILGNVNLVVDSKGPFSRAQEQELEEIVPSIKFHHLGRIDWASIDTLKTELKAFEIVSKTVSTDDYIAKVDSDILFYSSEKLKEILCSNALFVGDGHYSNYKYAQGGLYLMRRRLAEHISYTKQPELLEAINKCGSISEDRVISALVQKSTDKIWLTRLMLFPDEYSKANLSGYWVKKEFCSLHFVKNKKDMPEYAKRLNCL